MAYNSAGGATDQVYLALRQRIFSGELSAGGRLTEVSIGKTFGVSRTPVREAFRRLDAEGLVALEPHRGARVVAQDAQELHESFELRALLEGFAAEQAAQRIDSGGISLLSRLAKAMESVARTRDTAALESVAQLNHRFHAAVIGAAQNQSLARLLSTIVHRPLFGRVFGDYPPDALAQSFAHHRELVSALKSGDSHSAGAVMRAHVMWGRSVYVRMRGSAA